jgi:hypothetical protein
MVKYFKNNFSVKNIFVNRERTQFFLVNREIFAVLKVGLFSRRLNSAFAAKN